MTSAIRQCPFYDHTTHVEVAGQQVEIRPFQIILWASLQIADSRSPRFPVILDTGHSLNVSIREEQLRSWLGIDPAALAVIGHTTLNRQPVLLSRADLALYQNVPGKRDAILAAEPVLLELFEGIVVHAAGDLLAPRLPLLGLRALVRNGLRLTINGRRKHVSLTQG